MSTVDMAAVGVDGSPRREPTIDALRALAVAGVVTGHWLVTAVVVDPVGWSVASPLRTMPALIPATWILQTLAPLFLAAGYAAAVSARHAPGHRAWLGRRVLRAVRAVGHLAAFWLPLLLVLALTGTPFAVIRRIGWYVVSPLWFLGVLVALLALTPLLVRFQRRFGITAVVAPVLVVAADDLARFGPWPVAAGLPAGVPAVLGCTACCLAVLCGWLVPYQFGIALAGSDVNRAGWAAALIGVGVTAAVLLVAGAGYPVSMVGGAGGRSNLDPPSLLELAFGAVQVGAFLSARPWLARIMNRPRVRAAVAGLNRLAMPVYLWHQSALVLVILTSALVAPMPGLVDAPSDPLWLVRRVCWLPVVAAVLAGLFLAVGRAGRPTRPTPHRRSNA